MKSLRELVPQEVKNIYHFCQAFLAALIYGFPSRKLKIIAVTGTDGKTTVVNLIHHILKSSGVKVSMISTTRTIIGEANFDTGFHVTTPSPFEVQKFLRLMIKAGSEVAVLEVTSHALDQNRVAFVNFHTGVITNITAEHLDYHKSFSTYVKTKAKILAGVKYRVLNADDKSFSSLATKGSGKLLSFGVKNEAGLQAVDIQDGKDDTSFTINLGGRKKISVTTPLPGIFNVYNCLAACAVAKIFDVENKVTTSALKKFPGVVGRMEEVKEDQNFKVVVDFAHTPAALEQAVRALRSRTPGSLICIFGCASERDTFKRPIMGQIAGRLCDFTILTSEDPRRENPQQIIDQIAAGLKKEGRVLNKDFWEIPDRAAAIKEAIVNLAKEGDTIGIFGKGHEKSMNIGGVEYPWSDQMVARNNLQERLNK